MTPCGRVVPFGNPVKLDERCFVLDDKLVERAQKLTGIRTKREVVHEALRTLILLKEQGEIRNLRGKLKWEGDLDEQRQSRFTAK